MHKSLNPPHLSTQSPIQRPSIYQIVHFPDQKHPSPILTSSTLVSYLISVLVQSLSRLISTVVSYPFLPHPVLSNPVLSHRVLSCLIPSCPFPSCPVPSRPVPHLTSPEPSRPVLALIRLDSSLPVPSRPVPIQSCPNPVLSQSSPFPSFAVLSHKALTYSVLPILSCLQHPLKTPTAYVL